MRHHARPATSSSRVVGRALEVEDAPDLLRRRGTSRRGRRGCSRAGAHAARGHRAGVGLHRPAEAGGQLGAGLSRGRAGRHRQQRRRRTVGADPAGRQGRARHRDRGSATDAPRGPGCCACGARRGPRLDRRGEHAGARRGRTWCSTASSASAGGVGCTGRQPSCSPPSARQWWRWTCPPASTATRDRSWALRVTAAVTVCFGVLKPGLLVEPGRQYAGTVTVVDIGLPAITESSAIRAGPRRIWRVCRPRRTRTSIGAESSASVPAVSSTRARPCSRSAGARASGVGMVSFASAGAAHAPSGRRARPGGVARDRLGSRRGARRAGGRRLVRRTRPGQLRAGSGRVAQRPGRHWAGGRRRLRRCSCSPKRR